MQKHFEEKIFTKFCFEWCASRKSSLYLVRVVVVRIYNLYIIRVSCPGTMSFYVAHFRELVEQRDLVFSFITSMENYLGWKKIQLLWLCVLWMHYPMMNKKGRKKIHVQRQCITKNWDNLSHNERRKKAHRNKLGSIKNLEGTHKKIHTDR